MQKFAMIRFVQKIYALIAATSLLILSANSNAADASAVVHLRGSTTLLPIAQIIGEAYMEEQAGTGIVVSGGGTARGYKALLDGTADIAMASSVIPEDVLADVKQKNIELHNTLLGYATIVTVVHPSNPVNSLTLKQLRDVFTGRVHNWKQIGGTDSPIKVFVGPPSGGITDTWKRLILGDDDTYTPAGIVLSNDDRITQIEEHRDAITFLTLGTLHSSKLKILKINDVSPDSNTVNDGRYLLRAPLMMITKNTPSPATQAFINYISAPQRMPHIDGIVNIYSRD